MKKYVLLFFIVFFAVSCIVFSCSKKIELQETNEIFSISHDYKPNKTLLLNQEDDILCIAYYKNTDKRIEIINLINKEKKVIRLPEHVSGQHLLSVDPDSVYLYDNISCEIHLITPMGNVRTINLLSVIKQNNIRFYPPSQIYHNALYVSGYNFNQNKTIDNNIASETKILKEIMQNERIFIFNNLFTDSIYANQILSNFVNSEIVKINDFTSTDFLKIKIFKNAIISFHANSNLLFVFDKASGKIVNKIKMISDYSSLKAPLVHLYNSEKEKESFIKQRQESNFLNGVIYNIIFDEYRNLYYVTTLLPNKDFHYLNNLTFERDWSLIVLNKDFDKVGEFLFDGAKFDFRIIHPIKEGILIENKNIINGNEKSEFILFKVY